MKIYYIKNNKCVDLTPSLTKEQELKLIKLGVTTLLVYKVISNPVSVFASSSAISDGIKPIVDLVVDMAEPVSYIFMTKGFLQLGSGRESEGKKAIKLAGSGFLGIQFMPQIFKIIKGIKIS